MVDKQHDSDNGQSGIEPASPDEFEDLLAGIPVLQTTLFAHRTSTAGRQVPFLFSALCEALTKPTAASKESAPLFRLVTSQGASRAEGTPLLKVFAVVGDYDGETVGVHEAKQRLFDAGLEAFVYTTGSHTEAAPRWRVVVPLAEPCEVGEYPALVDGLNGALGGILAGESWKASQCYFYGRVRGVPFESRQVRGLPLDTVMLAPSFDPMGPSATPTATARRERTQPLRSAGDDLERAITIGRATVQTIEELRDALATIPADERSVWVDVGIALASLKGSEHEEVARQLWVEWSRTSAAYRDGDDQQWATFEAVEATHLKVFALAAEHGWKNPAKATLETERERSARIGREGEHHVPTQRVMTGSEMLEELVFVANGSCVAFIDRPRFIQPFCDFKNYTAASVEQVKAPGGRAKKVSRASLWLESPDRKTVLTQTFAAGRPPICDNPEGDIALNSWRPRREQPPEDWATLAAPFFHHVAYLVPVETERERFLDWLAHIEQAPGVLPHSHYLLVAKETGIGRNWLAYALARCFAGYTALGFDLAESLRSGFNGALSQRLLAVVDELHEGGPGAATRAGAEKLKSLLTEATRRINPKYGKQHVEFNATRFLMFSNHEDALPLAENDRRVVVIENPSERRSAAYYTELYQLLDQPGFGAALAEAFKRRDISGFNPGEIAPMNAAKARTIRAGRSEMEAAIRALAADWPSDCITSSSLQLSVQLALGGRIGSTQGACVAAGLHKFEKRVKVAGIASHVWILRNADKWAGALPGSVAAEVLRGEAVHAADEFA